MRKIAEKESVFPPRLMAYTSKENIECHKIQYFLNLKGRILKLNSFFHNIPLCSETTESQLL